MQIERVGRCNLQILNIFRQRNCSLSYKNYCSSHKKYDGFTIKSKRIKKNSWEETKVDICDIITLHVTIITVIML